MFLSKNLKFLLNLRGVKQSSFAEQIHASRGSVIKYIQGLSIPNAEVLLSMSDYFGVSVDALLRVDMTTEGVPQGTIHEQMEKKLNELDQKIQYLQEINELKDKLLTEYETKYKTQREH